MNGAGAYVTSPPAATLTTALPTVTATTALPTAAGTPAATPGSPQRESQIPTVPPQLSASADAAVAANSLLGRLRAGSGAALVLDAQGPWHDGNLRLLGVARKYRLARPVDTEQEFWPVVDYVDRERSTTYRRAGAWMRVRGLRELSVQVDLEGHVVEVRSTDHDGVSDVDVDRPGPTSD